MNGKARPKLVRIGSVTRLTKGGMGMFLEIGAMFQMTPP